MFSTLHVELVSGELDVELPARVQVSMFNPYCSGKYLFALSSWLRSCGFSTIEYQISDTLQRHNFAWREHLGPEQSLARSIQSGEKWLTQNASVIQLCFQAFDKVSVSRWDYWINHDKFCAKRDMLRDLYGQDSGFRMAVDSEIESYFKSIARTLTPDRKNLSAEFLIEEIAVSDLSAECFPANEIYPGPRIAPEQYLVESDIPNLALRDLRFIHVRFVDGAPR
jgi:hypothetical protein